MAETGPAFGRPGENEAAPALVIQADMAGMVRLADWVDELGATLPPARLFALRLCTEELVANVMMHGRPAPGADAVAVRISLLSAPEALYLRVEDDGLAFDPTTVAAPAPPGSLEQAQIGGVGLVLVRRFSTSLRYERAEAVNRLDLVVAG